MFSNYDEAFLRIFSFHFTAKTLRKVTRIALSWKNEKKEESVIGQ